MTAVKQKMIYFITGASGVGKTTLVNQLETKYWNKPWAFLHFDKIGVPSMDEMVRDFGSGAKWQEAKTYEWIEKLIRIECEKVFFEGQVSLHFIRNGFSRHGYTTYRTILIDCSEDVMRDRLVSDRNQPELFTPEMLNWLKYLRDQANEFNAIIIDASNLSKEELLQKFEEKISCQ
jgi:dephospho-CoA kinase